MSGVPEHRTAKAERIDIGGENGPSIDPLPYSRPSAIPPATGSAFQVVGDMNESVVRNTPSLLRIGLTGVCPSCGEGKLFSRFLTIAKACRHCDQSFEFADSGDGPAVFIIMFVGFIVVAGILTMEVLYQPPYWVHGAVWLPVTAALCLLLLRPFKAVLVALQYRNRAAEAKFDNNDLD